MTFILKNPPNSNPASQGSSLTEGKRSKRSKRNGDPNGDQDDQDSTLDTSGVDNSIDNTVSILLIVCGITIRKQIILL